MTDSDTTINANTDVLVLTTTLSTNRTVTLSSAASYTNGRTLTIVSNNFTGASGYIVLTPAGGETLNGPYLGGNLNVGNYGFNSAYYLRLVLRAVTASEWTTEPMVVTDNYYFDHIVTPQLGLVFANLVHFEDNVIVNQTLSAANVFTGGLTATSSATITGNISSSGHYLSAGSTPTIADGSGGATASIVRGTDAALVATVTTSNPAVTNDELFTVTFATPYATTPVVSPGQPYSSNASDPLPGVFVSATTDSFTVYLRAGGAVLPQCQLTVSFTIIGVP